MQLYYTAGSPYARMIRMAVLETGLGARITPVETTLRDPSSTLLPLSPVGRVPTLLLADGTALTETALILVHLSRAAPAAMPPLLPLDGAEGARGMAALGRVIGFMDGIAVWNRELRRPKHERSPGVIALETTRANRVADVLERDVAEGGFREVAAPWIALACALGYCERRHRAWPWREGRPALAAWLDAAAARPSFAATVPPLSGL